MCTEHLEESLLIRAEPVLRVAPLQFALQWSAALASLDLLTDLFVHQLDQPDDLALIIEHRREQQRFDVIATQLRQVWG